MGVFSPILLKVDSYKCELPGREEPAESEVVALSRDTGLKGGSIRVSLSVDLDLPKENPGLLERFDGCEWLSSAGFAFLLNVRHIDATLDSDSFLLPSRVRVPKPNFLRSDDAFELIEPVLNDRVRVKEPVPPLPSLGPVSTSPNRAS